MSDNQNHVADGIYLSSQGEATVSQEAADSLFEIALAMEPASRHPVDVQHVLAAIVLASRAGQISPSRKLSASDAALQQILTPHIETVFEKFGGKVGEDD